MSWKYLLPVLMIAAPVTAQDAAAVKKPNATFRDCPDCQTMVVLPAGRFRMGSTLEERTREGVAPVFGDHEEPIRDIVFAKPFAMAATETTRGQFAQFVRETKRPLPTECATYNPKDDSWAGVPGNLANWRKPGFAQDDTHPVVCISFTDATDYAAWFSKKTGHQYRLPSEAEWEYAARAGTTTTRYWGDSIAPICTKTHIMTAATMTAINNSPGWNDELMCAGDQADTVPVGSFDANPWGLYDMLGNVWEWVADCAAPDHATLPADGSAQTTGGDCTKRLTKGGAFHSRVWLARPATRGGGQDGVNRPVASGIRLVRDLP